MTNVPRVVDDSGWEISRVNRMTSTSFEISGYRIVETLGVVRGIMVRSRSIVGLTVAGLQTLIGGRISMFTQLCERTRGEAFELMVQHAVDMGANGVIGIRYDATEIMKGVTEVICYGTAVILEEGTAA